MSEKNLLTGHIKGEREKKRKASTYFDVLRRDEKEEKETFVCVCVCVWNERISADAAAECASARRETDVM